LGIIFLIFEKETSESCVDEINDSRGNNEESEENISQKSNLVELSSGKRLKG